MPHTCQLAQVRPGDRFPLRLKLCHRPTQPFLWSLLHGAGGLAPGSLTTDLKRGTPRPPVGGDRPGVHLRELHDAPVRGAQLLGLYLCLGGSYPFLGYPEPGLQKGQGQLAVHLGHLGEQIMARLMALS